MRTIFNSDESTEGSAMFWQQSAHWSSSLPQLMVRFIMTQSRWGEFDCVCEKTKQPVKVRPVRRQLRSNNGGAGQTGEKNAKIGIFSEITLPPHQETSQAKRVNINGQKNYFCHQLNNTVLIFLPFNERKYWNLAALLVWLSKQREGSLSIIETTLGGNKQKFFSKTGGSHYEVVLASSIVIHATITITPD